MGTRWLLRVFRRRSPKVRITHDAAGNHQYETEVKPGEEARANHDAELVAAINGGYDGGFGDRGVEIARAIVAYEASNPTAYLATECFAFCEKHMRDVAAVEHKKYVKRMRASGDKTCDFEFSAGFWPADAEDLNEAAVVDPLYDEFVYDVFVDETVKRVVLEAWSTINGGHQYSNTPHDERAFNTRMCMSPKLFLKIGWNHQRLQSES